MRMNKIKARRILIYMILIPSMTVAILLVIYLCVRQNVYVPVKEETPVAEESKNILPVPEILEEPVEIENEEIGYEEQKGITNILLVGTDARNLKENSRADAIIIATIDSINRKLKLTSIMRDSYVSIKAHSSQKINTAYAYGGPELLLNTIERNFRVKIDKYVIINFQGFEEIIDFAGGIDVDIKDYEVNEINKYIGELREVKSPPITRSGMQHLDGQQALAYSRIRKVGNGSYERNERQRRVLSLLAQELKDISVSQYPAVLSKLLQCIKTNIEPINFLNYAYTLSKFKPLETEQLQIPVTELSDGRIYKGNWVFLMDKEQNAKVLNDFIFRDKITQSEELNIKAFRSKINEYLKAELKSNPSVNQKDPRLKKEPEKSNHGS